LQAFQPIQVVRPLCAEWALSPKGIQAMKSKFLFTTALLAICLVGCAKNGQQQARNDPSQFEKAKEPPINANTHFAAGQLAEDRQQYAKAEYQYKKAIAQDNKHEQALFRLGCLQASQKRYPEAIETWKRYLKVTSGSADAYSNLAYCEELAGNPAAAESDYQRGVAKDPKNETCRVNYGLMLARHGRMNEAILQFQSVLTPAEVHYNLASVYELSNRKEMARLEYQQALELDPNMMEAKAKLAQLSLN
jgi:tetratricopeptide (TPR) repeat protein